MSNYTKTTENQIILSNTYNQIEQEVNELDLIENWNERVDKMKDLREKIIEEQDKLGKLINMVIKNEPIQIEIKKKKKQNLDNLVSNFKNATSLEEKIKLYYIINSYINEIETKLFDS
jgi:hypothetical protein